MNVKFLMMMTLWIYRTRLYDIENELGEKIFETERESRKAIASIW